MTETNQFILEKDAIMRPYSREVAAYCNPFYCKDEDLDEFFAQDAILYDDELLGRTYAWIETNDLTKIVGMVTLANDSVKTKLMASTARNRFQRNVSNAKRGRSYPAVLIGRLGVSEECRGKGWNIGSQIMDFLKDWFRSNDNKTGCRFIVVDAYNNERTLNFYLKNGFKMLYKTEDEERTFFELEPEAPLATRFMYFDLKWK